MKRLNYFNMIDSIAEGEKVWEKKNSAMEQGIDVDFHRELERETSLCFK